MWLNPLFPFITSNIFCHLDMPITLKSSSSTFLFSNSSLYLSLFLHFTIICKKKKKKKNKRRQHFWHLARSPSPSFINSNSHIAAGHASVQFSCSVMSNSLRPDESQHTRPPCPSPTPGVHSNSHPLSL